MENDPLPSWHDGASKQAILAFVAAVTDEDGARFVPLADRIAVFDNDGTLWTEQPLYAQAFFILERVKAAAADHPEWATEQPYAAILSGDHAAMAGFTESDLAKLVAVAHAGMTTTAFAETARQWADKGISPLTKRRFTESVYQPQLELLAYLRANGFRVYIVSGGGIDLMRVFSRQVYGVAPDMVIGSSGKVAYSLEDGVPTLTKLPALQSYDDHAGKPVNIHLHIGQRPILAFGNSDGDQEMLEYVTAGDGPSLGLLLHHDDAAREVAYDRDSKIGKLDTALDKAAASGWVVVSMADDWAQVFSFSE
ncbi:MAG: HAD family hydrolase [Thermomicrobiales bacterium]